jgi:hypothetical protein
MKIEILPLPLFCALLLISTVGYTRNPYNAHPAPNNYKNERSGCNTPIDSFDLHINNVRAPLLDDGELWLGHRSAYQIVDTALLGLAPPYEIFVGSIWLSALDQGNNLKVAAFSHSQSSNSDYYTGPLDNNGNVTVTTCNQWDQHFTVFSTDISLCINAYQSSGTGQVPIGVVCANDSNMIRWPGKGNAYLSAQGYDVSGILAPFFDANGDGIYNPLDGDYPTLQQCGTAPANTGIGCDSLRSISRSYYADEMIFWVMNDEGNTHGSGGAPLGIQVNTLAFAFQDTNFINNASFYTYNVINKSGSVLNQAYFSLWTDIDLGCANNDRVGCDTSRNIAFQYNGFVQGATTMNGVTCDDPDVCPTGESGFGCNLPILGIQFLEGATDTIINPSTGQPARMGMTSFCYFSNAGPYAQNDPTTATGFRNYQESLWNDGTHFTYGGNGYGGTTPVNFMFPGSPAISNQWSECNPQDSLAIAAGDRRFEQTTGPFTFMPCSSQFFTIAVLFVDPPGGVGTNCPGFSFIEPAADSAQALFDRNFYHFNPIVSGIENIQANNMKVYPNPVSDLLYLSTSGQPIDNVFVYDLMGRLVLSQSVNNSSVDMSKLSDGVYFVKTDSDSEQTFKIVKK